MRDLSPGQYLSGETLGEAVAHSTIIRMKFRVDNILKWLNLKMYL